MQWLNFQINSKWDEQIGTIERINSNQEEQYV